MMWIEIVVGVAELGILVWLFGGFKGGIDG